MSLKQIISALIIITEFSACSLFETKNTRPLSNVIYTKQEWLKAEHALLQIKQWRLVGKINIRTPKDSVTAAINQWTQIDDNFTLELSSTFFGLGATKLYGNSHFLTITESGEAPLSSNQPNALIEEALGFSLPISYLSSWVKALPTPNSPYKTEFNTQGLPKSIIQDRWKIEFSKYSFESGVPLPGKIKLHRDNTRIILAIKKWTLL